MTAPLVERIESEWTAYTNSLLNKYVGLSRSNAVHLTEHANTSSAGC